MPQNDDQAKKGKTQIPTETDWGSYASDLDQKYAHEYFAGRSNEEMQPHFRHNPIEATSELGFMPEVPFRYYMLGLRDFVMSSDFQPLDASDAASCFLRLILEKLKSQPNHIVPVMPELLPAIRYVVNNQAKFEAAEKIYGNFRETLAQIESLFAGSGAS
jgi:hypothetical protein